MLVLLVAASDGQWVGPIVFGPDETIPDGLPGKTREMFKRITKRLRLGLRWKDKSGLA